MKNAEGGTEANGSRLFGIFYSVFRILPSLSYLLYSTFCQKAE
jgi:hypothetical protein